MQLDVHDLSIAADHWPNTEWAAAPIDTASDIWIHPQHNSASALYNGYPDGTQYFCREDYLTTYSSPAYPLDPTAFHTDIASEDPSYLHISQPYNEPPHPQFSPATFTYFNS